jgi:hypothetical protein
MAIVGYQGRVTSYDLAVGIKINMDEAIYMISPIDSPLINGIGSDGRQILASSGVDQTTFKWMDEELLLPRADVSVINATSGATPVSVTVATADAYKFQIDDLVVLGKEGVGGVAEQAVMRITDPDHGSSPAVMTVTAWVNGSDWPAQAVGDLVICVGTALVEGSDPGVARTADRTIRQNYTQIFGPTPVDMTRTEQQITRYGVNDEFAKQLYGRTVENVITREQAYLYGKPVDDTANKRRSTGGLMNFITTNTDATSTCLDVAELQTLMQKCYNAGGVPDLLIANPATFADLNAVESNNRVRTVIDDPRRGRVPVTSVFHEFGETQMVRNRWCHSETAFVVKKDGLQRRIMQPLIVEALAKTGDSDSVMLLCEEGLQVKGETHMARFTNLTDYTDTP